MSGDDGHDVSWAFSTGKVGGPSGPHGKLYSRRLHQTFKIPRGASGQLALWNRPTMDLVTVSMLCPGIEVEGLRAFSHPKGYLRTKILASSRHTNSSVFARTQAWGHLAGPCSKSTRKKHSWKARASTREGDTHPHPFENGHELNLTSAWSLKSRVS